MACDEAAIVRRLFALRASINAAMDFGNADCERSVWETALPPLREVQPEIDRLREQLRAARWDG